MVVMQNRMTFTPTLTRRAFGALGCLSVLAAVAACGSSPSVSGAGGERGLTVMITCYPTRYLMEKLGGDLLSIIDPIKPGVDPHGLELSVQQVAQMSEADLVVQIEHYQSAVDDAIASHNLSNVLNINDHVTMLPAAAEGDEDDHAHEEDAHAHEDAHGDHMHEGGEASDGGGDEHEHAEEGHEEEGHDHGGIDPHFWHDPLLMLTAAKAIAAKLSALSPENAHAFNKNLAALEEELTELDAELKKEFGAIEGEKAFITSHTAFAYLARHYGLHQIGIAGIDPENEPSTQRLLELAALIKSENLTTVFFETTASPKVAEALAARTGATASELDNLETQLDESKDYAAVMRENSSKLVKSWQ